MINKIRAFVAVNLQEDAKKAIRKIQKQLPEFKGKKTEEENLHLTLKFFGEIDEEQTEEVRERLRKVKLRKFYSEINSLGVFDENFIRIIWLHLSNAENLQEEIDRSLEGIFEKERRFMGHLTIARVKNIKDKKKFLEKLGKIRIDRIKFLVDSFSLVKSELTPEGPVYSVIEKYILK